MSFVSARQRATTSSAPGSTRWVAPSRPATSRRAATGSDTITFAAPASRAPCTIESPIPPAPITSTVAPSSTCAVLSTAPTPVCTAQPITHAISVGTSLGIFTAPVACVMTLLGEARDAEAAIDDLPAPRQARAAVGERARHDLVRVHAQRVLVAHAPVAGAARRCGSEHHAVARRESDHARSDPLDHARGLVPEHDRQAHRGILGVDDAEIRVTDAAVLHRDANLARPRIGHFEIVDDVERLVLLFE
jgi:hypothetical protein